MNHIHPGLVLALIAGCVGVFPAVHAAQGLWQAKFDKSTAIRAGYVPGQGESWLCRYIDAKGLARVGAYYTNNPGCEVHKDNTGNALEFIPVIKDMKKVQFLSTDPRGVHSYAWIGSKKVKSLAGAIPAGRPASKQQTYVCRATSFYLIPHRTGIQELEVIPGTYYPGSGQCVIANPYRSVDDFDILFDLYSMCDNKGNSKNPTAYKKGTWVAKFERAKAVEAGLEQKPGEYSYVCRVRKGPNVFVGKHKSSGGSCGHVDGDKVIWGPTEEVLVSTPSTFYGWSPQRRGTIGDGAMHGAVAPNGEPIFICRALADVDGFRVPRSPGELQPSDGVCVTAIENRVARNPKYEVLVDMRRTCDDRKRRNLHSGVPEPHEASPDTRDSARLLSSVPLGAPMDAIKKKRALLSEPSYAGADEYLARGLTVVKLALDSFASS